MTVIGGNGINWIISVDGGGVGGRVMIISTIGGGSTVANFLIGQTEMGMEVCHGMIDIIFDSPFLEDSGEEVNGFDDCRTSVNGAGNGDRIPIGVYKFPTRGYLMEDIINRGGW